MTIRHLVWLLLSLVASTTAAQTPQPCDLKGGAVLEDKNPTLYISFEGFDESSPAATRLASAEQPSEKLQQKQAKAKTKRAEFIWLRLHNNTRWAISLPTESLYLGPTVSPIRLCNGRSVLGLKDGRKITVRYEFELVNRPDSVAATQRRQLQLLDRSDVFSSAWLPAGGSLLFSVPSEYLSKDSVYVPYQYEWEYGDRTFATNEPQHRVYFRSSDLPTDVQSRIQ